MSELLRSVMVECAEMARAGRRPAPFYGCAHGAGGGPAMGIVQPPRALEPQRLEATPPAFAGPVIVYDRGTAPASTAPIVPPNRDRRPQPTPRHTAPMRRVA